MAEAYLNCGNGELGSAARGCASRHGYTISTGTGYMGALVNGNQRW